MSQINILWKNFEKFSKNLNHIYDTGDRRYVAIFQLFTSSFTSNTILGFAFTTICANISAHDTCSKVYQAIAEFQFVE